MKKDIKVKMRTYVDKNGETKNYWMKIGTLVQTDKGESINIECFPVIEGGWNGWASVFEAKEEFAPKPQYQARPNLRQEPSSSKPVFDDDSIPF